MIYYEDIGDNVTHRKISTNTLPRKGEVAQQWGDFGAAASPSPPFTERLLSHISRLLCGCFLCRSWSGLAFCRSSTFRRSSAFCRSLSLSLSLCFSFLGFTLCRCWLGLEMFRVNIDSQRCFRTEHSRAFRSNRAKLGFTIRKGCSILGRKSKTIKLSPTASSPSLAGSSLAGSTLCVRSTTILGEILCTSHCLKQSSATLARPNVLKNIQYLHLSKLCLHVCTICKYAIKFAHYTKSLTFGCFLGIPRNSSSSSSSLATSKAS